MSLSTKKNNFYLIKNRPNIIIGTRSSFFLPIFNLKTIIIDEAHDTSLIQDSFPRYNLVYGSRLLIEQIILSTATINPLLKEIIDNSYFKLIKGGEFYPLNFKVRKSTLLSRSSLLSIGRSILKGKIPLIFVNHRGYSNRIIDHKYLSYLRCKNCKNFIFYHFKRG